MPRFVLTSLLSLAFALAATAAPVRLRLMAANLTSGNNQSYDPGHGARIMQGVNPDVVMLQEFNVGSNTTAELRAWVTATFGASFHYALETQSGDNIPNGVVSRYPIVASGEWMDVQVPDRDFFWARIDVPGPVDLWAVSVHLHSGGGQSSRNIQAGNLVNYINANVPAGDYLAIGGDFNSDSRSEPQFATFANVVSVTGPHPADKNGNGNTNASRGKPYDGVYVDADLRQWQTAVVIGNSTYANGLVVDTRVHTPLSEISPAQAGDSAATNMQHMGVVKDFLLPGPPPPSDPPDLPIIASTLTGSPPTVTITFGSTPEAVYEVRASDTLDAAAWTVLGTVTAASTQTMVTLTPTGPAGAARFVDPALGTAPRRFYRIVRP